MVVLGKLVCVELLVSGVWPVDTGGGLARLVSFSYVTSLPDGRLDCTERRDPNSDEFMEACAPAQMEVAVAMQWLGAVTSVVHVGQIEISEGGFVLATISCGKL